MSPQEATASATRRGSAASSGGGAWLVFTLQKLHPRVHVSPISMMVAVAVPSLPPQHSPRLGHFASSHTVARFRDLTEAARRSRFSRRCPVGASMRSQGGLASRSDPCAPAAGTSSPAGTMGAQPGAKDVRGGAASSCSRRRARREATGAGAEAGEAEAVAAAVAERARLREWRSIQTKIR